MYMLVETKDCGFRAVQLDGLYPIGTPVPFATGEHIIHGKVVGYGQAFDDGLPVQHYLVKLADGWWTNLFKTHITLVVVHPESVKGSVQCDPEVVGGCGCEFRMDDSVLHRWADGELSWMCKEHAGTGEDYA